MLYCHPYILSRIFFDGAKVEIYKLTGNSF